MTASAKQRSYIQELLLLCECRTMHLLFYSSTKYKLSRLSGQYFSIQCISSGLAPLNEQQSIKTGIYTIEHARRVESCSHDHCWNWSFFINWHYVSFCSGVSCKAFSNQHIIYIYIYSMSHYTYINLVLLLS